MKRKYKKACFGGTFDIPIHKGHEALIRKAFEVSGFCYIGIMSDFYVLSKRKKGAKAFEDRKKNMVKLLRSKGIHAKRYEITELDKFFGKEVIDHDAEIEAIVVSEKTMPGARGINIIRGDLGMKPLDIVKVETIKSKNGTPICSTDIRANRIDRKGNVTRKRS